MQQAHTFCPPHSGCFPRVERRLRRTVRPVAVIRVFWEVGCVGGASGGPLGRPESSGHRWEAPAAGLWEDMVRQAEGSRKIDSLERG